MDPFSFVSGIIGAVLGAVVGLVVGFRQVNATAAAASKQADATLEAVKLTIARDDARAVRRQREQTAGLMLAQARLRVRLLRRIAAFSKAGRQQLTFALIDQLIVVDAQADDLLTRTVADPGFRAAAEAFVALIDELVSRVVESADRGTSSWAGLGDAIAARDAELTAAHDELQRAADDWINGPT